MENIIAGPITKEQQKQANAIARKHRCGRATTVRLEEGITEGYVVDSTPYGIRTKSGGFIPHHTSNYPGERYEPATCIVHLPA